MKTITAMLLAVITFANLASADRILIYHGSQSNSTNSGHPQMDASYLILDLTTFQYVYILYGGSGGGKFSSLFGPFSFVNSPIGVPGGKTKSCFVFGSTTSTSPYTFTLGTFSGINSPLVLNTGLTADYPKILIYSYRGVAGDGTEPDDSITTIMGTYNFNSKFTMQSNDTNDTLTQATNIVTTYLTVKGY